MKKILYRKFLYDCSIFFLISLISASIIIWVFQAVNYLDLIIEDGRNYWVYLNYSILNFPKIASKILPFAFFFSFSYVIAKYELNNELLIYWNFGINKINVINFFFLFSLILLIIQIFITSFVVPKSQSLARLIIRSSDYNFSSNFIKVKRFNAALNDVTIYTDSKNLDGSYNNIYIKRNTKNLINKKQNNFQVIFAKKGFLQTDNNMPILILFDGKSTNVVNDKVTNFNFSKSKFDLSSFSTNTILVTKTQELSTKELIICIMGFQKKGSLFYEKTKTIRNCELKNLDNIYTELYKRLGIPFYIPILMLISLLLIVHSKERKNFTKQRAKIFIFGLAVIIFSESTLRFVSDTFQDNIFLIIIPISMMAFLYSYFLIKYKFKNG